MIVLVIDTFCYCTEFVFVYSLIINELTEAKEISGMQWKSLEELITSNSCDRYLEIAVLIESLNILEMF